MSMKRNHWFGALAEGKTFAFIISGEAGSAFKSPSI